MNQKQSEKQLEVRNSLPDDLKPVFDDFIADYKYAATLRYGRPYISYDVIADMVKTGWRPSARSANRHS
jgi:predicted methyltransferase